jgi:hypothetical protein
VWSIGALERAQGPTNAIKVAGTVKVLAAEGWYSWHLISFPGEALGTELLRRCLVGKNCEQCPFQVDSLTLQENAKYEIILNKPCLGEGKKKGIASYLFIQNVHKLIKIYCQARGCMTRIEKIPVKAGKTLEFNKQFQDNVDRGAVRKLSKKKWKHTKNPWIILQWLEHTWAIS